MENILFKDLEVSQELLRAIAEMGFEEATPIQSQSIIPILEGNDVLAQAPTGTGKTCAFGIPLIEKVNSKEPTVQGLVLCPTRELAIQTTNELMKLAKYKSGIKVVPIYGGQQIDRQITALKKKPQIIIATPGRLMDHMRRKTVSLNNLKNIILDEADEMLNMGFREDIDLILKSVPEERQTTLFSATISNEILNITKSYQKNPVTIKVTHKQITVPSVEQFYVEVRPGRKLEALTGLIDMNDYKLSMVFCNTKRMVDELAESLVALGYQAEGLHGDMKQSQRDKVMNRFKQSSVEILIATDVAARGIDVDNIEAVFNYDIPNDEEYYVHRIGRTGRANKTGVSYTFVGGRDLYKLREIMKYTKANIVPMKIPNLTQVSTIKSNRALDEMMKLIEEGKHQKYVATIEHFIDDCELDVTTLDLAAAFLSKVVGVDEVAKKMVSIRKEKEESRAKDRSQTGRLFMNIGRMDKVNRNIIAELLASTDCISANEVQKVEVLDKFSFVTVPTERIEELVSALNDTTYQERRLAVEQADRKGSGSRGGRSDRNRGDKGFKKKSNFGDKGRDFKKKDRSSSYGASFGRNKK